MVHLQVLEVLLEVLEGYLEVFQDVEYPQCPEMKEVSVEVLQTNSSLQKEANLP